MEAVVGSDTTIRTIMLTVTGGEPIDVTEPWQSRRHVIRPDRVTIVMQGAEVYSMKVSGKVLKKDGTPGEVRASRTWETYSHKIKDAPEQYRKIWDEAPKGVVRFAWTQDAA